MKVKGAASKLHCFYRMVARSIVLIAAFSFLSVRCQNTYKSRTTINRRDGIKEVTMTAQNQCGITIDLKPDELKGYRLFMELARYKCSDSQRGYNCERTFRVRDSFDMPGKQLCVDLQGIAESVRGQCKFNVNIISGNSQLEKGIYCSSYPTNDAPRYLCVEGSIVTLALVSPRHVPVCPDILEHLFTTKVLMGTVSLQPIMPIYLVDLSTCEDIRILDESKFTVKVWGDGHRHCTVATKLIYPKMKGCLTQLQPSYDNCNIEVILRSPGSGAVRLDINKPIGQSSCGHFSADDGDVNLQIWSESRSICNGRLAFEVEFTSISRDEDKDVSNGDSSKVFMAIFIALIIVCIICLGLTCLCCIRFRTKRLRDARRPRSRHGAPASNEGYEGSLDPTATSEGNISWSQSHPNGIFGLPSYEDVTGGERPGGVNPVGGDPKADLPPSYDSIFASDS